MGGKLREAEGLEPVQEPGSGSPQPAGSQLFRLFGKLVTVICPRTEPLLHGSYPFHTPTPPPPSLSATHTHRHTHTQHENQRRTAPKVLGSRMDHLKMNKLIEKINMYFISS